MMPAVIQGEPARKNGPLKPVSPLDEYHAIVALKFTFVRKFMKRLYILLAAIATLQVLSSPAVAQSIYERIDSYYEQRYLEFVDIVESDSCSQVIMARVTEISTETYLQRNPYSEPEFSQHVGRRIWIDIEQTWKHSESAPESVMTHGGSLPHDVWKDDVESVNECHSSIDISVEKGQRVILAVTLNNPVYSDAAWTWGADRGKVDPDPQSHTFRPGEESTEFSPEVLLYLDVRKQRLVDDVLDYLNSTW